MAMTLLKARKRSDNTFHLCVHLDSTKTLASGEPDPAYVREYDWPAVPQGTIQTDYVTQIKQETKLLAQSELDHIQAHAAAGTALPGEGNTL